MNNYYKFTEKDVSKYYVDKNNNIYQLIAYCACPSVTLERITTKERITFGINGLMADDYTRLIKESEE